MSFIKKDPLSEGTHIPSIFVNVPGVDKRKVLVMKKVITARVLPYSPALGTKKPTQSATAAVISIIPTIRDTVLRLNIRYIHPINGLFRTKSAMPFASVGVNLNIPSQIRTIAIPKVVVATAMLLVVIRFSVFTLFLLIVE